MDSHFIRYCVYYFGPRKEFVGVGSSAKTFDDALPYAKGLVAMHGLVHDAMHPHVLHIDTRWHMAYQYSIVHVYVNCIHRGWIILHWLGIECGIEIGMTPEYWHSAASIPEGYHAPTTSIFKRLDPHSRLVFLFLCRLSVFLPK